MVYFSLNILLAIMFTIHISHQGINVHLAMFIVHLAMLKVHLAMFKVHLGM